MNKEFQLQFPPQFTDISPTDLNADEILVTVPIETVKQFPFTKTKRPKLVPA